METEMADQVNRALETAGHIPHSEIEEHHPGPREYVQIAAILTVITSIEVAVYYVDALRDFLAYILITLSAVKFFLVVAWYMHLRFDNRLYSYFFVFGLGVAATVIISFLILFDHLL
jgi:cytochrome c oxidase subunit 4